MKQLNKHTIKRLQKLAGIDEIRIGKPGKYKLKDIIEPVLGSDPWGENYLYSNVYDILIMWLEGFSGDDDPTNEYTTDIDLGSLKDLMAAGTNTEEENWVEMASNLIPNQIYIHNNGEYESYKFTTDSKGGLFVSTPTGISDTGTLLSKYDESGKLIPN